ncbi:MAG: cysteine synthase A, partial [Deltaproteobacteria bacterium]|nr:cysteine synthase A [Deltaproteobacteria bacterium]
MNLNPTIVQTIGATPLVRLNRIARELKGEIYV